MATYDAASALVLALHILSVTAQVCDPSQYTGTGTKKVPILPKTFMATIEANIIDQGFTVDTIEVVDQDSNMIKIMETATVDQQTGTVTTTEIFDFKNNQVATFARIPNRTIGTCSVTDITKAGDRYLFGQLSSDDSGNRFFTTQGAFVLTKQFPANYKGSTRSPRGIIVDEWENCITLPEMGAKVKANWYFTSDTDWNSATGVSQVPAGLSIQGTVTDNNGRVRNINHTYEFVHFRATLSDEMKVSGFQVPYSAVCPGLKATKTVPKIPDSFSFTSEIVIPNAGVTTAVREFYDSKMMTSRFDYTGTDGSGMSEVHDWRSGLAYVTNLVYGNCSIQPIQGGFDAQSLGNNKVRMMTSNEFFGLADNKVPFTYIGQRKIREVPCDVFNALKTNWPAGSGEDSLSIWEIAFSQPSFQITGGPVNLEQQEPFQLSITHLTNPSISQVYNIINFDESQPDFERFDVGGCYQRNQTTRLSFALDGQFNTLVVGGGRILFRYFTMLSLVAYTGLPPIRLTGLQVDSDDDGSILVALSILDPPAVNIGDLCDTCPKSKADVPTDDAIALLRDAIDTGKFVVKADIDNVNDLSSVVAKKNSLIVGRNRKTEVVTNDIVQLDAGAAAGIAIGLFVVGFLIAVGVNLLIAKIRGPNLPPFMKMFSAPN